MRKTPFNAALAAGALSGFVAIAVPARAQSSYTISTIDDGNALVVPVAINAHDEVCGWIDQEGITGFIWQNGTLSFQNDLENVGLNDKGIVVTQYFPNDRYFTDDANGDQATRTLDLPNPPFTEDVKYFDVGGINVSGLAAGVVRTPERPYKIYGFTDDWAGNTKLFTPRVGGARAVAINASGAVLLQCDEKQDIPGPASVVYQSGKYDFISPRGSVSTSVRFFTDSGAVGGSYQESGSTTSHGFVKTGRKYRIYDYPGATNTFVLNIGPAGQVIGAFDAANEGGGFVFSNGHYYEIKFPGLKRAAAVAVSSAGSFLLMSEVSPNKTIGAVATCPTTLCLH